MIKKLGSNITAILLSVAMVFTMMPLTHCGVQTASAAESGDGGTVASNSEADAKAAFGESNVTVSKSGSTLTIKLGNSIELENPVRFVKGSSGDKVVLDLNGKDITGANGVDSTDENAAKGKDAIQIIPADYDVEIIGQGSITGGNGAVFERSDHYKKGTRGGDAVAFVANENKSYWNPSEDDAELKNGLIVSGGAVLTGGSGADLSGDDWKYNIAYCKTEQYTLYDNPQFILLAGAGGAGIGQPNTGIAYAETPLAYAKIIINGATIIGGEGGHIDMGTDDTPILTHYALMNDPAIGQYMSGESPLGTMTITSQTGSNLLLEMAETA